MAADLSAPVTIAQLDALSPVAGAWAWSTAGGVEDFTAPRSGCRDRPAAQNFGTEVAARMMGLRLRPPGAQAALELSANDVAMRGRGCLPAAHILGFTGGEAARVSAAGRGLPAAGACPGNQRARSSRSRSRLRYPDIWGGRASDRRIPSATRKQVPGGFDCSALARRVNKQQAYTGGGNLGSDAEGPHHLRDQRRDALVASGSGSRSSSPAMRTTLAPAGRRPGPTNRPHGYLRRRRLVRRCLVPGRCPLAALVARALSASPGAAARSPKPASPSMVDRRSARG